ncbi:hemerythrin domain-containing protein [Paenibacillus aurantiacus]|uniref:Hemerythrin domain-containing protein n=1 Tax=Paenibacillus aurantiacus TaxID=1936118 RepID=A0ABV5KKG6_9BACL
MQMTTSKAATLEPGNSARISGFMELAQRLQREHEQLKDRCGALCELSRRAASSTSLIEAAPLLSELRTQAASLLALLERHSTWEDGELFPFFSRYYKLKMEPTIMPSLWVLEKDHELAVQFFESFLQKSDALIGLLSMDTQGAKLTEVKQSCDDLTQGCLILTSHFEMEEELIYPMAEDILTDMDYLFS